MQHRTRALLIAAMSGVLGLSASWTTDAATTAVDGAAAASSPADRFGPPDPDPAPGEGPLPVRARPVDTSRSDRVVGTGTPASCTSQAVVEAVARGGIITFDCGPGDVTIEMTATAKVVNTSPVVVLDGGGRVTLSGQDSRRILYMNTCDRAQVWTTSHCQNQDHPRLTIQNIGFTRGNATGQTTIDGGGGGGSGGAVYVRGGQLSVINSTFTSNRCDTTGPDVGGAALRVLSQFDGRPVVVAGSTFGGSPATANICSNGGAISSIGVSWEIFNSVFRHNRAIGNGANPARPATPGGGSGGAIYLDGNDFTLELYSSLIEDNTANEGGGAIFFVSNNRTGQLHIALSALRRNPSLGFETRGYPGIFYLGSGPPRVTRSVIAN